MMKQENEKQDGKGEKMNPKYYRSLTNKCPWCSKESPKTGNECGHLNKVTAKGVYFWYWGIRPIKQVQEVVKTETFKERIADQNKTPLATEFVQFIKRTAQANSKSVDEIWNLWKRYSIDCRCMDQSPVKSEFLAWNKLKTS